VRASCRGTRDTGSGCCRERAGLFAPGFEATYRNLQRPDAGRISHSQRAAADRGCVPGAGWTGGQWEASREDTAPDGKALAAKARHVHCCGPEPRARRTKQRRAVVSGPPCFRPSLRDLLFLRTPPPSLEGLGYCPHGGGITNGSVPAHFELDALGAVGGSFLGFARSHAAAGSFKVMSFLQ
jgi:hypothetical protein